MYDCDSHKDKFLFTYMVQLKPYIFWSQEVSIVRKNLATLRKGFRIDEYLTFYLPYKVFIAFPLGDNLGFVVALYILRAPK